MIFLKFTKEFKRMTKKEKAYAATVLPLWLAFTAYIFIGIPLGVL